MKMYKNKLVIIFGLSEFANFESGYKSFNFGYYLAFLLLLNYFKSDRYI